VPKPVERRKVAISGTAGIDTRMHETSTASPVISEPLSWAEICERYPDQWVALVEIDWIVEYNFKFRTARVAGSGKTRREPLDQARPLRSLYWEIGHFFTGPFTLPLVRPFL
jgi:hypothetical protein